MKFVRVTKTHPSHKTSKQHWHWWLPVLTGKPTPSEIKTEFRFFNRDTIKPAVEEVNEVSELSVTVHEFKSGRTIEWIQFEVHVKQGTSAKDSKPIDLSKVARAIQFGIDPDIAEDHFLRHGELAFSNAIDRLESRLSMPGTPILSRHAYLEVFVCLAKLSTSRHLSSISLSSMKSPIAKAADPGVQAQEVLRERGAEKLKMVREELSNLEESARAQLLSELQDQLH